LTIPDNLEELLDALARKAQGKALTAKDTVVLNAWLNRNNPPKPTGAAKFGETGMGS